MVFRVFLLKVLNYLVLDTNEELTEEHLDWNDQDSNDNANAAHTVTYFEALRADTGTEPFTLPLFNDLLHFFFVIIVAYHVFFLKNILNRASIVVFIFLLLQPSLLLDLIPEPN